MLIILLILIMIFIKIFFDDNKFYVNNYDNYYNETDMNDKYDDNINYNYYTFYYREKLIKQY